MRVVSDDTWAVMTIWCEARGEPWNGKVAVGEVIRNRTEKKYSSDGTIPGTVLRPYQFSCWNTRDENRLWAAKLEDTDPSVRECIRAWEEVKAGTNLTKGAVLYYNPFVVAPKWAEAMTEVALIGRHKFFTDP